MRQHGKQQAPQNAEETVRDIRRATRRQFSAEEKIRIVLEGLRGEDSMGLSGILCVRPVSSLADEPFAEDDGELGLGLEPFARRAFPFLGGVVQHQI